MTSDRRFILGFEDFQTSLSKLQTVQDMGDRHVMAQGNSIEEARCKLDEQIPNGMSVISERVACDGEPQMLRGVGETVAIAFQDALSRASTDAEVIQQRTISEPTTASISIEAFDEAGAMQQANEHLGEGRRVADIEKKAKGRAGFLGIGRKPHTYELVICTPAKVEITVRPQIALEATVGLPRIQKAISIVPTFASALDSLVKNKRLGGSGDQYTKLEIIEAFLFALLQQDIGWSSYEINGITRHDRAVSSLRWSSSSEAVTVKYHRDYADGSEGDSVIEIVRLSEETFAFKGEYGTIPIGNVYGGLTICTQSLGDPPQYFLEHVGIEDVLEEALRRGVCDG